MLGDVVDVFTSERDTWPPLDARLDAPGLTTLAAASQVRFFAVRDDAGAVITGACTVLDAAARTVRYQWDSDDTLAPGRYTGVFIVTWAAGGSTTFPNDEPLRLNVQATGRPA